MNKSKKVTIVGVITFFVTLIIITYFNLIIITTNYDSETTLGIIDGVLSKDYDNNNIIINSIIKIDSQQLTHGDLMLAFAMKYAPNIKIVYYDASNEDGVIDTESIISGLNWMRENGVKKINISLSSSEYSSDFGEYVLNNKNYFTAYSSYHNLEQSLDYPSMYNGVVASGKKSRIVFKDIDISYKSKKILLFEKEPQFYNGNSYLSLITAIND